jgi:hypothetical protein
VYTCEYKVYSLSIAFDPVQEHLNLTSATVLPTGEACLHMVFTAMLNDNMRGFYRSTYTDTDGKKKIMAVSQFEVRASVKFLRFMNTSWTIPYVEHLNFPSSTFPKIARKLSNKAV